nr:glucomannan 4-beta-mannosyltransferase 2-like [Tanacetum cinerariifolium]
MDTRAIGRLDHSVEVVNNNLSFLYLYLRRLKGILWLVSELEVEVVVLKAYDGEKRGVWQRWVEVGLVFLVFPDEGKTDQDTQTQIIKISHTSGARITNLVRYQIRESRGGYKAGALKEGLKHDYVKDCDYKKPD